MWNRFKEFSNVWELIAGRLLFRGTQVQVHRVGDVHMIVDHRFADAGSVRSCVADDMYRKLLAKVSLPKDLRVLDIGANAGGFPFLLHALGHRIIDLTSVELNPKTFVRLQFNILTNWPQARVLNRAITQEAGTLTVRLGGGDTGDSIRGTPVGAGDEVTVETLRLDDLPDTGPVDLLKMDIEHAEAEVLLNAGHEKTLARTQVLVIEIHPEDKAAAIHAAIEASGLRHVTGTGDGVGQHIFARDTAAGSA